MVRRAVAGFEHSTKFRKIQKCCQLAQDHQIDWAWVDTCCIDKASSADITEAINSMFEWYRAAKMCFAFLEDAPASNNLRKCRWFTRGWTLQELLAPRTVLFYDRELRYLGNRRDLHRSIARITKIERRFLVGATNDDQPTPLSAASIAQRMSWASTRTTTRPEDMAYCLLGLFDVNMPLLYGEGQKAFARLQEHIIRQSDDESIFAWVALESSYVKVPNIAAPVRGILATDVRDFRRSAHAVRAPFSGYRRPPYEVTSQGLRVHAISASWLQRLLNVCCNPPSYLTGKYHIFELQCIDTKDGGRVAIHLIRDAQTYYRVAGDQASVLTFERSYFEGRLLAWTSKQIYVSLRVTEEDMPVPTTDIHSELAAQRFGLDICYAVVAVALLRYWIGAHGDDVIRLCKILYVIMIILLLKFETCNTNELAKAIARASVMSFRPSMIEIMIVNSLRFHNITVDSDLDTDKDHIFRTFVVRNMVYSIAFSQLAYLLGSTASDSFVRFMVCLTCSFVVIDMVGIVGWFT